MIAIKEIDEMRGACRNKIIYGEFFPFRCGMSRSFNEDAVKLQAEHMLSIYLSAGITFDMMRAESERNRKSCTKSLWPSQMATARRFVEYHKDVISRKGVFHVYRGYSRLYYGDYSTPVISDVSGDAYGVQSGGFWQEAFYMQYKYAPRAEGAGKVKKSLARRIIDWFSLNPQEPKA